ncbi:hypothetical protein [uncultured Thermanaerothrix sp.]|uniref:hypothetical protein n=1 Tax=uncultured Thermanaerothrix sp. TaxID=1195149 RepID=UPI00262D9911|nr:hypothetical protein [uncultured Thermanaerothrix sp.]
MTVLRLAYFISSHGFGHAARAAAVMENLKQKCPGVEFEIFTQVPTWFFEDTLGDGFVYHEYPADVGIVQRTPWDEDLHATFMAHAQRLPFPDEETSALSDQIRRAGCRAVLCDIAPLGIAVAEQAGLPSFLIENFTWDWIFEGYLTEEPRLASLISYYRDWFARASYHIQTDPSCEPRSHDLCVEPVSRSPKHSRSEIRARLAIPETTPTLLITMGGIEHRYAALAALREYSGVVFVIPGSASQPTRDGNLVLLPHRSGFYHPDLLFASDAVIGKVGYSTIAEAYHAGIPFGYAIRERFRESAPLAEFIRRHMPSLQIPTTEFMNGTWVKYLDELLALPHRATAETAPNGAAQIATFILEHLD